MADGDDALPPEEPPEGEEQPEGEEPVEEAQPGPADEPAMPSFDEFAAQLQAIPIASFLLSTVSTLASIAYGKLAAKQFDDARGAIDAIAALLPVLEGRIEPALKRDFEQALTNLQLAYADASAKG